MAGRKLIIGGVEIPHELGLLGHSDADVLLHAIIDALLGAAGMGDIGRLFPDTDARYRGADSRVLLRQVRSRLAAAGWEETSSNEEAYVMGHEASAIESISPRRRQELALGVAGAVGVGVVVVAGALIRRQRRRRRSA